MEGVFEGSCFELFWIGKRKILEEGGGILNWEGSIYKGMR